MVETISTKVNGIKAGIIYNDDPYFGVDGGKRVVTYLHTEHGLHRTDVLVESDFTGLGEEWKERYFLENAYSSYISDVNG
jgi:hypothetical protein